MISYWVNQRTREIGIRSALGAARGDVIKMVLRRGLVLTCGGIFCGLLAAAALSQLVARFLYGANPLNAEMFLGASLVPGLGRSCGLLRPRAACDQGRSDDRAAIRVAMFLISDFWSSFCR